ncbi:hypothetical protein [Effusibacillus dendaii]|uniref:Uncharacterized protein n=1 Tax=Effusibacillus dendaii TaxID=2743772 RepID=A0A7I8DDQ8_9BACL|nr:hypothetical protein [Effusibacillus dendaii]BCJ88254.1 hypothetical protein skT53_32390 [Effusibacillus dendaii]
MKLIEEQRSNIEQKRAQLAEWKQAIEELERQIGRLKEEIGVSSSKMAGYQQKTELAQAEHTTVIQSLLEKEESVKKAELALKESLASIGADTVDQAVQDIQTKDKRVAKAL